MGSRPVFYLGYEPGSWVLTPACKSDPFAPDSVTVSAPPAARCALVLGFLRTAWAAL
jgi:hypothetical protein